MTNSHSVPVSAEALSALRVVLEKAVSLGKEMAALRERADEIVRLEYGATNELVWDLWEELVDDLAEETAPADRLLDMLKTAFPPSRDPRCLSLAEMCDLDDGHPVVQFLVDWMRHDTLKSPQPVVAAGLPIFANALCELMDNKMGYAAVMRREALAIMRSDDARQNRTDVVALRLNELIMNFTRADPATG